MKRYVALLIVFVLIIILTLFSRYCDSKTSNSITSVSRSAPTSSTTLSTEYSNDTITSARFKAIMNQKRFPITTEANEDGVKESYSAINSVYDNDHYVIYYYRLGNNDSALDFFVKQYHNALRDGFDVNYGYSGSINDYALYMDDDDTELRKLYNVELYKYEGVDICGDAVQQYIILKRKGNVVIKAYSYSENLGTLQTIDRRSEINKLINNL